MGKSKKIIHKPGYKKKLSHSESQNEHKQIPPVAENNEAIINEQQQQIVNQTFHSLNSYKTTIHILEAEVCYKISNFGNEDQEICIVDGSFTVNGKQVLNSITIQSQYHIVAESQSDHQCNKQALFTKIAALHHISNLQQILSWIQASIDHNKFYTIISVAVRKQSQNLIRISKSSRPWQNLRVENYLKNLNIKTTMLIGLKNTGKSMFCEYCINLARASRRELCVMDVDIGRNRGYPGAVTLTIVKNGLQQNISVWIGEFTPLNNVRKYLRAISSLYALYQQNYFTSCLIINTMGYLTGLGELMIYETFNIIGPQQVLFMESANNSHNVVNIKNSISSGQYLDRLYFTQKYPQKTSSKFSHYQNKLASQKPNPRRFETLLTKHSIKSIDQLIQLIIHRKLKPLKQSYKTYRQDKNGNITSHEEQMDMRIVLLGQFLDEDLFVMKGVGFGFNSLIYFDNELVAMEAVNAAMVSDGIDFDKVFYQMSESKLIMLEEMYGIDLPYIGPAFKGLGNKGVRNNSAKRSNA